MGHGRAGYRRLVTGLSGRSAGTGCPTPSDARAGRDAGSSPSTSACPTVMSVSDAQRTGLFDRIEGDLADVETALGRLDAGTYDTCEMCSTELPDDALATAPTVRRCTACSTR